MNVEFEGTAEDIYIYNNVEKILTLFSLAILGTRIRNESICKNWVNEEILKGISRK